MGAILDYIASAIIFGVLVLSVGRIQTNVNATMYQNTFNVIVQQNAVDLARQIEFDFLKMGYHVFGQKVGAASSSGVTFRAAFQDNYDTVAVQYSVGTTSQMSQTANPYDFPLFRRERATTVQQNWGLTSFRIAYYDSVDAVLSTPIVGADSLNLIRAVNVRFVIQSPEPVIGPNGDSTWASVTWQKLMYPRNLGKLNLTK